MTSFDLINSVHKKFFDQGTSVLDNVLNSWSKVTGFPFWNVVKYSEGKYGLELGLAGFKKENVLVEVEDGVLTIEGKVNDSAQLTMYKKVYLLNLFLNNFHYLMKQ
jgi:HSP20 family molecular chaperone IbpA